jgi:hypothetical protein
MHDFQDPFRSTVLVEPACYKRHTWRGFC